MNFLEKNTKKNTSRKGREKGGTHYLAYYGSR
jgi:hypothetical protein